MKTKNHIGAKILINNKLVLIPNACKKIILLLLFAIIIVFVLQFSSSFVDIAYGDSKKGSGTKESVEADLSKAIEEVLDRLHFEGLQKFIESLSGDEKDFLSVESIKSFLKQLSNGDSGNYFEKLFSILGATFGRYFLSFLPSFITILIICILKSMLQKMTSDFLDNSTTEVVHIVVYAAIITILMTGVIKIIGTVVNTINLLASFSEAVFPIVLTLLSSVGGATTVATFSPMLAVLSGGIISIITKIIVPAFIGTIVFSVVGNLSKSVKLEKLTHLIKTASTWLIGVVFGLFAAFLTAQGITGGVVDKFGFNVAKFALSGYVPILGGYLSDGFDLISASVVIVKNALGYFSAITLVCIIVFPLLKVMAFSLTLRFISAIVEPIGDERVAKLLHSVAENMNLLITALAGVGFLFFIMIMLMIGSCNMGI